MVIVRLLAEMITLAFFILLPACILIVPQLHLIPAIQKIVICTVGLLAACILPFYGFVTWRVKIDGDGLTAIALFKKTFAPWSSLLELSFKSTWTLRRYVLIFAGGELSFPIWLTEVKELVQLLRSRLPDKASAARRSRQRLFKQDLFGLTMQFVRICLGLLFIAVFWLFFATICSGKHQSTADFALVLGGCIGATVVLGWRCLAVALIPKALQLNESDLVVRTVFFERKLPWANVKKLSPSCF